MCIRDSGFRGHRTADVPYDATPEALEGALGALLSVGSVAVIRNASTAGPSFDDPDLQGFEFRVEFLPAAKCDRRHALTFGDLPPLEPLLVVSGASNAAAAANANASIHVFASGDTSPNGVGTFDGSSPFMAAQVVSAAVSPEHVSSSSDRPAPFNQLTNHSTNHCDKFHPSTIRP